MTLAELRTDAVIVTCAISAGIHGALVPEHFDEGAGAGLGFLGATVALAVLAVLVTYRPAQLVLLATAAVFAGLIAAYAVVVWTGMPVVHPEREALDGLALFTKAVEAAGLVLAVGLLRRPSISLALSHPKGTLT